jgi:sarcosine oxidase subunit beta
MVGRQLAAVPAMLQMHLTARVPPLLDHLVQHISQGLSVKQVTAGQVLIGGGWPGEPPADPGGRATTTMASMIGNLSLAARIIPSLAGLSLLRAWAGPVLATADEMPVVGALDGLPGLFVCGGTYAFTLAPLWAEVLTAFVTGAEAPVDVRDLSPDRLVEPPAPSGATIPAVSSLSPER